MAPALRCACLAPGHACLHDQPSLPWALVACLTRPRCFFLQCSVRTTATNVIRRFSTPARCASMQGALPTTTWDQAAPARRCACADHGPALLAWPAGARLAGAALALNCPAVCSLQLPCSDNCERCVRAGPWKCDAGSCSPGYGLDPSTHGCSQVRLHHPWAARLLASA